MIYLVGGKEFVSCSFPVKEQCFYLLTVWTYVFCGLSRAVASMRQDEAIVSS